jgi:hypothetical protein
MRTFKRSLSEECKVALQELANETAGNWWKDVLASKELLLAVRRGYLNAYARGQSIFKIGYETGTGVVAGKPRVAIHFKYLIKRDLEGSSSYIPFDGTSFDVKPMDVVHTRYTPGSTLPALIQTARRYAGPEKAGVHRIAAKEPRVVDLEIAFTKGGEAEERSTAPRMDVAVLVPGQSGSARLVFCEAKCADNAELWQPLENATVGKNSIAVAGQISVYEEFIREPKNAEALITAYTSVCKTLIELRDQRWVRKLDPLVEDVATGRASLTIHPRVYLLVYGFDTDQRRGALKRRLEMLASDDMLGNRVIAKGNPDSFNLSDDILRCERRI